MSESMYVSIIYAWACLSNSWSVLPFVRIRRIVGKQMDFGHPQLERKQGQEKLVLLLRLDLEAAVGGKFVVSFTSCEKRCTMELS